MNAMLPIRPARPHAIIPMAVSVMEGDALDRLRRLPSGRVHTCVTSPPYYGLRDYGMDGQLGHEATPELFVARLVEIFREVRRVLRDDGTLWVNIGDSYATNPKGSTGNRVSINSRGGKRDGSNDPMPKFDKSRIEGLKKKDLIGIPWMLAFALRADGWYLRQDIIWHKPSPMPESVRDRCTKAHEYVFLLSKSADYYYDADAIKEPAIWAGKRPSAAKGTLKAKGEPLPDRLPFRAITEHRNKRSVWSITTKPFRGAHFATMPPELAEPCILAGSPPGGIVLDPFWGAGTTGLVAHRHGRKTIGIELNADYIEISRQRLQKAFPKAA